MTGPRRFYDPESLHVAAYDALLDPPPPEIAGDAAFYEALAREAEGPVLEIAIGTGRVGLALAEAGHEVVGIDASPAMLERAEEKRLALPAKAAGRVTLVEADMRNFHLARRFPLIIVPFRAFQCLLSVADQRAALSVMRAHLAPGGRLVINLFDPRLDLLIPDRAADGEAERVQNVTTGGAIEAVLEETVFDHVAQVRRDRWRYREYGKSGDVVRAEVLELALRWTYRWEMRHLLSLEGLEVEAEFSDFERAPPAYGREQIWVARSARPLSERP